MLNNQVEKHIKLIGGKPSIKYPGRYDVYSAISLTSENLSELPFPFGIVHDIFSVSYNNLTSLYNAPIEVNGHFSCSNNQLTTLEHLPKYIEGDLLCYGNPLQNLNALKHVEIKGTLTFHAYRQEKELDYCFTVKHSLKIKALYNTDLEALEYHYDNHKYVFFAEGLEMYVINELEEIIKLKRLKRDLNI